MLAPTLNAFVIDNAPVAVSVEAPLIVTVPPKVVEPAAVSPLDALNTIVPLFDKVPELVNTALNVRVLDALIVNVCDAGIVSAPDKVVELLITTSVNLPPVSVNIESIIVFVKLPSLVVI